MNFNIRFVPVIFKKNLNKYTTLPKKIFFSCFFLSSCILCSNLTVVVSVNLKKINYKFVWNFFFFFLLFIGTKRSEKICLKKNNSLLRCIVFAKNYFTNIEIKKNFYFWAYFKTLLWNWLFLTKITVFFPSKIILVFLIQKKIKKKNFYL